MMINRGIGASELEVSDSCDPDFDAIHHHVPRSSQILILIPDYHVLIIFPIIWTVHVSPWVWTVGWSWGIFGANFSATPCCFQINHSWDWDCRSDMSVIHRYVTTSPNLWSNRNWSTRWYWKRWHNGRKMAHGCLMIYLLDMVLEKADKFWGIFQWIDWPPVFPWGSWIIFWPGTPWQAKEDMTFLYFLRANRSFFTGGILREALKGRESEAQQSISRRTSVETCRNARNPSLQSSQKTSVATPVGGFHEWGYP